MNAKVLNTGRLVLRPFSAEDAGFILRLLNEPSFLQYIGDKGVRTMEQAASYLQDGPIQGYAIHGHGLMRVEIQATGQPIGMCGLLRRKPTQDPDLGYAFLPESWGHGYAFEAARDTLESGVRSLGFHRMLALVSPDNARSILLLKKLGFTLAGSAPSDPSDRPTSIYEWGPGSSHPEHTSIH